MVILLVCIHSLVVIPFLTLMILTIIMPLSINHLVVPINNNPAPLITVPVTKGAIGNSGEGLLSAIAGGGLGSLATGFGGDALGVY
jgi:hypothetical protein